MARGVCVDCNFNGTLSQTGCCPRCGSDWTTAASGMSDDTQLFGLDGASAGGGHVHDMTTEELALYC